VDDSGGAQFNSIQAAVDAAAAGDVVIVRAGDYAPFALLGKGLAILADEGSIVRVIGTDGLAHTSIENVPAGERAVVRGVSFEPAQLNIAGPLLSVQNSSGVVWIEDATLDSTPSIPLFVRINQIAAVQVVNSGDVVLVNSVLQGSLGAAPGFGFEPGAVGLKAVGSDVFVHGCSIAAGGTYVQGGTGRAGVEVAGGELVLRDCTVTAAGGGTSGVLGTPSAGNGGPGLLVESGAVVWTFGGVLSGGAPGIYSGLGSGPSGQPGPASLVLSGALNAAPAARAYLSTTRIVRDDDPVLRDGTVMVDAVPRAAVLLLVDLDAIVGFAPGYPGFLGVGLNSWVLPAGRTDPLGRLSLSVGIPSLPPGLETWDLTVQAAVVSPGVGFELTNPSIFTVVDERF